MCRMFEIARRARAAVFVAEQRRRSRSARSRCPSARRADTRIALRRRAAGRSLLFATTIARDRRLVEQLAIVVTGERLAAIEHDDDQIRDVARAARARRLRVRRCRASRERRRCRRASRETVDVDRLGDEIAGRARHSVTIARSAPASALNRLDLPTFGRPAMTTGRAFANQAAARACSEQLVDRRR